MSWYLTVHHEDEDSPFEQETVELTQFPKVLVAMQANMSQSTKVISHLITHLKKSDRTAPRSLETVAEVCAKSQLSMLTNVLRYAISVP